MPVMIVARLLSVSLWCALSGVLPAHPLKLTTVTLTIEDHATEVTVVCHVPPLGGAKAETAIAQRLKLRLDGTPFRPSAVRAGYDPFNDTITWSAHAQGVPARVAIDAPLFPELPGDTTVVMVQRNGHLIEQAALSAESRGIIVGETKAAVFGRFAGMGVQHILSGADHVLFVLGLLLAGGTLRGLLCVVTAFSFAHSITLSMTALHVGSLPSWLVEPVIALSITAVGVENLLRCKTGCELRMWLAFGFGFFHGFGFAGALTEAGLPQHAVPWALAAFNTGVETGQACIVVGAVPALHILRSRTASGGKVMHYASLAIAVTGVFWFVQRVAA